MCTKSLKQLSKSVFFCGPKSKVMLGLLLVFVLASPLFAFPWDKQKATEATVVELQPIAQEGTLTPDLQLDSEEPVEVQATLPISSELQDTLRKQETVLTESLTTLQSLKVTSKNDKEALNSLKSDLQTVGTNLQNIQTEYDLKADEAEMLRREINKVHFGVGAMASYTTVDKLDFGASVMATMRKNNLLVTFGVGYPTMLSITQFKADKLTYNFGVIWEF